MTINTRKKYCKEYPMQRTSLSPSSMRNENQNYKIDELNKLCLQSQKASRYISASISKERH